MHTESWREPDGAIEHCKVADAGDFTCECDRIVTNPDNVIECSHCQKKFCRTCFEAAKEDFAGGIDAGGTGFDLCYGCSDAGLQRLLKDLEN